MLVCADGVGACAAPAVPTRAKKAIRARANEPEVVAAELLAELRG